MKNSGKHCRQKIAGIAGTGQKKRQATQVSLRGLNACHQKFCPLSRERHGVIIIR
jgi:hypothetical protein